MLEEQIEALKVAASPDMGLIPVEHIPLVWPSVQELLLEKGQSWLTMVSLEDVYAQLLSGQADLWCAMQHRELDGVVICCWERHAHVAYYHIAFICGTGLGKYLKKGLEKIEHFVAILGGNEVIMDARPGFARLLRRYGYDSQTVRLRKNVRVRWSD